MNSNKKSDKNRQTTTYRLARTKEKKNRNSGNARCIKRKDNRFIVSYDKIKERC